jgi:hypothetical protein
MFDTPIATATTLEGFAPHQDGGYAANTAREVIVAADDTREYMLASERALAAVWMTPEEDEAWKDL